MSLIQGKVVGVNGNLITATVEGKVSLNEVSYVITSDNKRLKAEIIRIKAKTIEMQVFEITKGIKIGDSVECTGLLLTVELGPGLLGKVYDGVTKPS